MNNAVLRSVCSILAVMFLYSCGGVKNTVLGAIQNNEGLRAYDKEDYETALERFSKGAEYGNAESAYYLAGMYADGKGTAKDDKVAAEWMQKSADGGYDPAQMQMGLRYLFGRGVDKDAVKAYALFLKAAEEENADAQYFTAFMLAIGHGTEKDSDGALQWFRLAKSNGFPVPENLLELDGVTAFGEKEWRGDVKAASAEKSGNEETPQAEEPVELSGKELILKVQSGLNRLGYKPGPADGIFGRKTEAAIKAFQSDKGVAVDGMVTEGLLRMIETTE